VAPAKGESAEAFVTKAARGIAGWGVCLGYNWVMTDVSTLRLSAACASPRFAFDLSALKFFFVTGKALSCGDNYFLEACGTPVTVGTK
jgi:hypothetical protein